MVGNLSLDNIFGHLFRQYRVLILIEKSFYYYLFDCHYYHLCWQDFRMLIVIQMIAMVMY